MKKPDRVSQTPIAQSLQYIVFCPACHAADSNDGVIETGPNGEWCDSAARVHRKSYGPMHICIVGYQVRV